MTNRKTYTVEEFKHEVEKEFLPLLQQVLRISLQVKSVGDRMYIVQYMALLGGGFPQQFCYSVYLSTEDNMVYFVEGVIQKGVEKSLN